MLWLHNVLNIFRLNKTLSFGLSYFVRGTKEKGHIHFGKSLRVERIEVIALTLSGLL